MEAKTKTKVMFRIPFKWVAITAYAILIVPILLFFMGWLKWYFGILFSGILLFGAFWMIKKDYWENKDVIEIPAMALFLVTVVFWIWIAISGSSWLGGQTFNADVPWKNAYLRDLVEYDWPVYYPENDSTLCYYFIFWMIPALFGKIFGLMGAFSVQRIYLLLIFIISLLIITNILKDSKTSTIWTICFFMMFFSGLIVLRGDIESILQLPGAPAYYRSHQNLLGNPYNQTPMFLTAALLMQNRRIHNFAFLGLIILPFSPWTTMGIAVLMIFMAIKELVAKKSMIYALTEIFSVPNICAVVSITIVFGLFFSGNSRLFGEAAGSVVRFVVPENYDIKYIVEAILFWLSEFGIYYIFVWKKYKKDPIFWMMIPLLMIYAYIWFGNTGWNDFASGGTSPLLFILMVYLIGYFKDEILYKEMKVKSILFVFCLAISFFNAYYDIRNKVGAMVQNASLVVENDGIYTFSNKDPREDWYLNHIRTDLDESKFFKYLGKPCKDTAPMVSDDLSEIKSITDIDEYFDYLSEKECTIYIAVQDIQGYSLRQETVDRIKALGFDNNVDTLMQWEYHSFIGMVNNGRIVTEQIGGDEHITFSSKDDGYPVTMESATLNTGNFSVINIKGRDYSIKGRGLNIVVEDNTTECVVDAVCFDTHTEEMTCRRKAQ